MAEITAKKLERIQDRWEELDVENALQVNRIGYEFEDIRKDLEEMGLDLEQDETYELLESGLTKDKFDKLYVRAVLNELLDTYHWTRSSSAGDNYVDTQHSRVAYSWQRIFETQLPRYEKAIADYGAPSGLSPLVEIELAMVQKLHQDGTLKQELKREAIAAAHDYFRSTLKLLKAVQEQKPDDLRVNTTRDGLSRANQVLEFIDVAEEFYEEKQIPTSYTTRGRLDTNADTALFSRAEVEKMQKVFEVKNLALMFLPAKKFQDEGHFVLDASGSGHGMMQMPMQEILTKLEEYGMDIRDPETFKQIGTDIDTFWDCYQRERREVVKDDRYNLVKPEFKR